MVLLNITSSLKTTKKTGNSSTYSMLQNLTRLVSYTVKKYHFTFLPSVTSQQTTFFLQQLIYVTVKDFLNLKNRNTWFFKCCLKIETNRFKVSDSLEPPYKTQFKKVKSRLIFVFSTTGTWITIFILQLFTFTLMVRFLVFGKIRGGNGINRYCSMLFLQVIIFVKSVQRCSALSGLLVEQNFPAIAIHRSMPQEER